jgi:OmpA-OmpF porin, OOP family
MNRKIGLPGMIWGTALIFISATPAVAMDSFDTGSIYIGAGGGQAENKDLNNDKDGSAWKAFVGYDFNRVLALEAGYVDLGTTNNGPIRAESKGPEIVGIITLPITDNFGVFGKGGVHRLEVKRTTLGVSSSTDRKTDATYGAGLKFAFNKNLSLRGEWERFQMDNNDNDLVSASLVFNFR